MQADVRAQNASPEETEQSVRQMLERLPYYGVFDYIVFRVDRGVVHLAGYSFEGRLKGDAEIAVKGRLEGRQMKNTAAWVLSLSLAGGTLSAQEPTTTSLLSKDLAGTPGKELLMTTVEYPPGVSDPVHRHDAQVMVSVLEGEVAMQVKGEAAVTLRAGDTFYEGPGDVHTVARNASQTASAKFLVFFVKDKGAPILVPTKWPAARHSRYATGESQCADAAGVVRRGACRGYAGRSSRAEPSGRHGASNRPWCGDETGQRMKT